MNMHTTVRYMIRSQILSPLQGEYRCMAYGIAAYSLRHGLGTCLCSEYIRQVLRIIKDCRFNPATALSSACDHRQVVHTMPLIPCSIICYQRNLGSKQAHRATRWPSVYGLAVSAIQSGHFHPITTCNTLTTQYSTKKRK